MEHKKKFLKSIDNTDVPDFLDMIFNEEVLLDLNILDFSLLRELAIYLGISEEKEMLAEMIYQLNVSLKEKLDQFEKNSTFTNYSVLANYSIFFMVLLINLKTKKTFVTTVFEKESKLVKTLLNVIKSSQSYSNLISKILCNLFLDDYKDIYFGNPNDKELEELFITNNEKFSKITNEGIDIYPKTIYQTMLDTLLTLDFSYEVLLAGCTLDDADKPAVKLKFVQSVIRVVFSKEKNIYLDPAAEFYEYRFIKFAITKDLTDTRAFYGDNCSCLFRRDDIYDDIIKFIFFIFGNSLLVRSFVKPLKKSLQLFEENEGILQIEDFLVFYEEFIQNIACYMPMLLKVALKTIYVKVNEIFTIEQDNFSPLYTVLIFNFFLSPKIQEIYDIGPSRYTCVRNLNRIIRNICYNAQFDAVDPLCGFNTILEKCNAKIRETLGSALSSFSEENEDTQRSLKESISDKYLIYPKFLFYIDSSYLASIFHYGLGECFNVQEVMRKNSTLLK